MTYSINSNVRNRGISILEVLAVLAVLGIIIGITVPQFSKTRENQVLKNGVADILASLDKARALTLSSLNSSEYGVHFQSDKVVIFKGSTYSVGSSDNEEISITSPASITNVILGGVSGASGDMYFNRLYGVPSAIGTITISTGNYSRIITISATGVASSN